MKKNIILLAIIFLPFMSISQDDKGVVSTKLYGFVKNDMFWDSRQTVSAREGHFLLFPATILKDADGNDINAVPNFNFLAVQTRVGIKITGAEALNAKVTGVVEGDFFAQANDNINLLRLRHAYFKLNWTSTELMIGQYWIPMFVTACFPGTISFNTGVPFQPFGRNPQIRLTQNFGSFKFIAIANSQRDYSSRGPAGTTGSYLRNSSIPEFSGQLHFDLKNNDGKTVFLTGTGVSYKSIVPEIKTDSNFATTADVSGYNAFAFMKISLPVFTLKMQGIYGQNIPDVLSIGGFGVASVDSAKMYKTYTSLNTLSFWADISTNINKVEIGVFGGYSQNMGAEKDIIGEIYGLGTSIESIYRISPRISLKVNKLKFALEGEYTSMKYGSAFSAKGLPTDLTEVSNIRVLFAAYYSF